jgi:hypothetical protein
MAKVGYIFKTAGYDALDTDKEWMEQYGCVQVVEESVGHETLRPRWKQLMSNLERGDELVVSKFSNAVRGLRELSALIELCRIKVVRIISIHDKIDTDNKLFPDTTPAEVLAHPFLIRIKRIVGISLEYITDFCRTIRWEYFHIQLEPNLSRSQLSGFKLLCERISF